jgi:hypothetical protein
MEGKRPERRDQARRRSAMGDNMPTFSPPKPPYHQVYRYRRGGAFVRCDIHPNSAVLDMAMSAEVILLVQDWPKKLSDAEMARFRAPFQQLMLFGDPVLDDPDGAGWVLKAEFLWKLHALRSAFVAEHDRHLLAGRGTHTEFGASRSLLLMVLVPTNIGSCEWQLNP